MKATKKTASSAMSAKKMKMGGASMKKTAPAKKMYGGTAKKMAKGGSMKAKC